MRYNHALIKERHPMNAFCPHCKQKYDVDANMLGQTADCTACGKEFVVTAADSPPAPVLPRAAQAMPPHPPTEPESLSRSPRERVPLVPAGLMLAAILCAVWAMLTAGISLRYLLVEAADDSWRVWGEEMTGAVFTGVWNMMIAGVYVLFAFRIPQIDKTWGYNWPFCSNILNAIFSLINILRCVEWNDGLRPEAIGAITLPIEIAIVLLLYFNRRHFFQNPDDDVFAGIARRMRKEK
jgi:hypothetical protein